MQSNLISEVHTTELWPLKELTKGKGILASGECQLLRSILSKSDYEIRRELVDDKFYVKLLAKGIVEEAPIDAITYRDVRVAAACLKYSFVNSPDFSEGFERATHELLALKTGTEIEKVRNLCVVAKNYKNINAQLALKFSNTALHIARRMMRQSKENSLNIETNQLLFELVKLYSTLQIKTAYKICKRLIEHQTYRVNGFCFIAKNDNEKNSKMASKCFSRICKETKNFSIVNYKPMLKIITSMKYFPINLPVETVEKIAEFELLNEGDERLELLCNLFKNYSHFDKPIKSSEILNSIKTIVMASNYKEWIWECQETEEEKSILSISRDSSKQEKFNKAPEIILSNSKFALKEFSLYDLYERNGILENNKSTLPISILEKIESSASISEELLKMEENIACPKQAILAGRKLKKNQPVFAIICFNKALEKIISNSFFSYEESEFNLQDLQVWNRVIKKYSGYGL